MKKIVPLGFILLSIILNQSFAANKLDCTHLTPKTENKNIILSIDQPNTTKIYIFQNTSNQSLWLDHPLVKRSASAGWASYLRPQKWSALLLNRNDFVMSCSVISPGKVEYKNCAKSISVCVPKKSAFESKRKGTYWLAEDLEWDELVSTLEKHGIITPSQEKEVIKNEPQEKSGTKTPSKGKNGIKNSSQDKQARSNKPRKKRD